MAMSPLAKAADELCRYLRTKCLSAVADELTTALEKEVERARSLSDGERFGGAVGGVPDAGRGREKVNG